MPITIFTGDDEVIGVTLLDKDTGDPIAIGSGATVTAVLRNKLSGEELHTPVSISYDSGWDSGMVTISLPSTVTSVLEPNGANELNLHIYVDDGGVRSTYPYEDVTIKAGG